MQERWVLNDVFIYLSCEAGVSGVTAVRVRRIGHAYAIAVVVCINVRQVARVAVVDVVGSRGHTFSVRIDITGTEDGSRHVIPVVSQTRTCQ